MKDVDNSPGYDQIINDTNVEGELKEAEQDRVERAITKDLGTTKERAPSTRSRLREVSGAPSEGEYEIDKILKRRQQPNGRYEYRVSGRWLAKRWWWTAIENACDAKEPQMHPHRTAKQTQQNR